MGVDLAQVLYTNTALTTLAKGVQMIKADLANSPNKKGSGNMPLSLAEQNGASPPQLRVTSGIGVLARDVTGWGGGEQRRPPGTGTLGGCELPLMPFCRV